MKILRIYLSTYQDHIKIVFDMCVTGLAEFDRNTSLQDCLQKNVHYCDPSAVIKSLNRVQPKNSWTPVSVIDGYNQTNAMFVTSNYTLPSDPGIAIDFLCAVDYFVIINNFTAVQVCDRGFDVNSGVNLGHQLKEAPVNLQLESVSRCLAKQFLMLQEDAAYGRVRSAVVDFLSNKLPINYEKKNEGIHACRFYSAAFSMDQLLMLKKDLVAGAVNLKSQLNIFSEIVNKNYNAAMFRFLQPAMGKIADDGNRYDYNYTEIELLREAIFSIKANGLVAVNWHENKAYEEHYAEKMRNHDILKKELIHLAPLIGLEFMPNLDFHNELVFTPACSKRLIDLGLNLNLQYVKNFCFAKNTYQTVYSYFRSKYSTDNMWHSLPDDILNEVASVLCHDKVKKLIYVERESIKQDAQSRVSVLK